MKKNTILLLSLVLVLVMTFTACGASDGEGGDNENKGAKSSKPGVIEIGPYVAEYQGFTLEKDINDNDIIAIKYNFTNNGEKARAFNWAFLNTLFQDGVELEYGVVFVNDDTTEMMDSNVSIDIKPGNTIEVITTNKLNSMDSIIEVDFEGIDYEGTQSFEIDLSK